MKGIGLDISTNVGWCLWEERQPTICRTFKLPKVRDEDDLGPRLWALMEWLEQQVIGIYRPIWIAFESPFIPFERDRERHDEFGGKKKFVTTQATLRLQISLCAIIETTAVKHKIKAYEVASGSAKKALAGNGRASKNDMILAATRLGWGVADEHQADACGVAMVVDDMLHDDAG